jgi:GTPase Era involved in 16S rRNA processing
MKPPDNSPAPGESGAIPADHPRGSAEEPPPPADIRRGRLLSWYRSLDQLCVDYLFAAERRDLAAAAERIVDMTRRVVIVGETSRGKTTLLNRLLGATVLDVAPTKSLIAVTGSQQYEDTTRRQVQVEASRLHHMAEEIIDTPGIAGPEDTVRLRPLTLTASAVVFVIAATSPFSKSERQLMNDLAADKLGGRLVVAVTMLDRLSGQDRDAVMAHVVRRVAQVAKEARVLPADAPETIRACLAETTSLDATAQREWDRTTAAFMADIAHRIGGEALRQAEEASEQSRRQEEKRLSQERTAKRLSVEIEKIRTQIDGSRLTVIEALEASAHTSFSKTCQQLQAQVHMASDPRRWWEDDLPAELWRELDSAARLIERRLAEFASADLGRIADEVEQLTGNRPLVLHPEVVGLEIARLRPAPAGVPSIAPLRHATAATAAAIIGYRLATSDHLRPMLPAAVTSGLTVIAGKLLVKMGTARAADAAAAALSSQIEPAFTDLARQAQDAGDRVYRQIGSKIEDLRQDLEPAPPTAPPHPQRTSADWKAVREKALALAHDIDCRYEGDETQ